MSVAESTDISAVRFVTNDPVKAVNVLESHGFTVKVKEVLAVEAPNHPGGLNALLKPLKEADININYLYTCLGRGENIVLIVDVDKMDQAMLNEELYAM